jgi:hypothetical protein
MTTKTSVQRDEAVEMGCQDLNTVESAHYVHSGATTERDAVSASPNDCETGFRH